MDFGEGLTSEYQQDKFLRERLKPLKDGWKKLYQMWENRQEHLAGS